MKKIVLILTSLILILAILLTIWHKNIDSATGIAIKIDDTEKIIPYSTLEKMSRTSFKTKRGEEYTGYKLMELLKDYDLQDMKYLILHSEDSGSLRLNKEDHNNAYLIWQSDSERPSLRLIIPTDEFGQRWMKYLTTIVLHK
jgi:uncharacterized protein YxeA